MKNRRYILVAIAMLLVFGVSMLVRIAARHNFMLSEPLTLPEASRFAEIQFFPGIVLEDNKFIGGLTRALYARLQLPRSELQVFLEQPRFNNKVSTSQSNLRDGLAGDALEQMQKKNWWPDKVQNYRAVDTLLRNTDSPKSLNMIVSLDDPKTVVVYLYVMDG